MFNHFYHFLPITRVIRSSIRFNTPTANYLFSYCSMKSSFDSFPKFCKSFFFFLFVFSFWFLIATCLSDKGLRNNVLADLFFRPYLIIYGFLTSKFFKEYFYFGILTPDGLRFSSNSYFFHIPITSYPSSKEFYFYLSFLSQKTTFRASMKPLNVNLFCLFEKYSKIFFNLLDSFVSSYLFPYNRKDLKTCSHSIKFKWEEISLNYSNVFYWGFMLEKHSKICRSRLFKIEFFADFL